MTGADHQPRKPILLTVDDDPAVSRAVARDLRRRYGDDYRIVRAESGPDALETLNELKLRGETVAVFVADYRMPQMSGIDFLEEAMDLYPMARRVLLTAYADTHAAIDQAGQLAAVVFERRRLAPARGCGDVVRGGGSPVAQPGQQLGSARSAVTATDIDGKAVRKRIANQRSPRGAVIDV